MNIWKLVDTFSGKICEQRITIIQAAENKARDEFNNGLLAQKLSNFVYLSDVEVASPTHSVDLLFHGQGRVKGDTKALHLRCKGNQTACKNNGIIIIVALSSCHKGRARAQLDENVYVSYTG